MYQLGIGPGDELYDLFNGVEVAATRLVERLHDKTHHTTGPLGE